VQSELDAVKVTVERKGDAVEVATAYPNPLHFPPVTFANTPADFDIEYHIRVPRDARVTIDNHAGEVHIDEVTGDIDAHVREGEITLHLPQDARYAIDARVKFGHINSDFGGQEKHRWWRTTRYMEFSPQQPPHKLRLRVGYGDIVILKTTTPKKP
jgi:hypothetical protein